MRRSLLSFFILLLLVNFFPIPETKAQTIIAPEIQPRSSWITKKQEKYTKERWKPKKNVNKLLSDFHTPKYIVVHHTEDMEGDSSIEKIRSIFQLHAVEKKWGDIGYHYLIDKDGLIYEGRKGGNGVRGAHALNSLNGRNYNYGSIGIAVIGNYNKDELPSAAQDSLAKLVGWLAYANNIKLDGKTKALVPINKKRGSLQKNYKKIPTLLTHRDVDDTTCPGDNVYEKLAEIEGQTKNYQAGYAQYAYLAGTKKAYVFKKGYRQTTKASFAHCRANINSSWFLTTQKYLAGPPILNVV